MVLLALLACSVDVSTSEDAAGKQSVSISVGTGTPASEVRELPAFSKAFTDSSIDLEVTVAEGPAKVEVFGREGELASIETTVADDRLTVTSASGSFGSRKVVVQVPRLFALGSLGSGDVQATLAGQDVAVHITSSGEVDLNDVGALTIRQDGSGDLKVDGVGAVALHSAGSGEIDIENLDGAVEIRRSGSGDVDVDGHVVGLDVTSDGSGDVKVDGIDGGPVTVLLKGAGAAELTGTADRADLSALGSGDLDASDLVLLNATVHAGRSGDIEVHATQLVDGKLEGSGNVKIEGGAASKVIDDGSGDVKL